MNVKEAREIYDIYLSNNHQAAMSDEQEKAYWTIIEAAEAFESLRLKMNRRINRLSYLESQALSLGSKMSAIEARSKINVLREILYA